MVSFLIIVIAVILLIFIFFKINNMRTKMAFLFIFLGVALLLLVGYLIFSGNQINSSTFEGVSSAAKTYIAWLGKAGSNVVQVSTYAFNQEWKSDDVKNDTG